MTICPSFVFYSIIAILVISYLIDQWLDYLNAQKFNDPIPEELQDVYDREEYLKSQEYKKTNFRFGWISSTVSLLATLLFLFLDGFAWADSLARSFSENNIVIALVFFGILMALSQVLSIPFSYYHTFVIEERFGFNKKTKALFFSDLLKGWLLGALIGGGLLALIVWFYESVGANFWLYAWAVVTVFSVVMNMFYARLIVPLFNKQTPLEEGSLKSKIEQYSQKVGFQLKNIFVIDGSKRSTKANAYFSGFGREKRITLFDTLIHDLSEEEIVSVLAHEVGHYKKNHIIINLLLSVALTGFTLWLLSVLIGSPVLSEALGVNTPSFHIGLMAFAILYSPVSGITGLIMNIFSRKFEYQADNFAKETYAADPLISSLKKLTKNNLSNLTPHPWYVFAHYTHPTLLQRFKNLKQ